MYRPILRHLSSDSGRETNVGGPCQCSNRQQGWGSGLLIVVEYSLEVVASNNVLVIYLSYHFFLLKYLCHVVIKILNLVIK